MAIYLTELVERTSYEFRGTLINTALHIGGALHSMYLLVCPTFLTLAGETTLLLALRVALLSEGVRCLAVEGKRLARYLFGSVALKFIHAQSATDLVEMV